MEIQQCLDQMKELHTLLINYIENPQNDESDFQNLIQLINEQNIMNSSQKIDIFIQLIISISNNFHRTTGFFNKIEHIIQYYKDNIKQNMTNDEIFERIESNKRILLFFIKEKIISINEYIITDFQMKEDLNENYANYFIPEFGKTDDIFKFSKSLTEYDENRRNGENDSYICTLIRNDSIVDFISYISKTDLPLSSQIPDSIFETNAFLNENRPNLIEYATFCGSIQIFQYLMNKNVKYDGKLWLYAVHSNNAEIIDFLENNKIEPEDQTYEECYAESIECHHYDIADYIESNFLTRKKIEIDEQIAKICYDAYKNNDNNFGLIYLCNDLCRYNFKSIINLLLNMNDESNEPKEKVEFDYKKCIQNAADENNYEVIYLLLLREKAIAYDFFKNNENIKTIIIPYSIQAIHDCAFEECINLKRVRIPSSVKSIEFHAFRKCSSLTRVKVPSSVSVSCFSVFIECENLDISSLFNYSVYSAIFKSPSCINTTNSYTIPDCIKIKRIKIPHPVSIIMEKSFKNCPLLTEVSIPNSVKTIDVYAFHHCENLKKVIFEKNSSLTLIDKYAFCGCASLINITIPASIVEVGQSAFVFCTGLTKVVFEEPSSLKKYGKDIFQNCDSLTDLSVPSFVDINIIKPNLHIDQHFIIFPKTL